MVLYKIGDRYPNYKDIYFEGSDLKGMSVYGAQNQAVGQVCELLIDESDRLKYLVVDIKGQQPESRKQVLLPVRSCARTTDSNVLYAHNLSSDAVNQLEVYSEDNHLADRHLADHHLAQSNAFQSNAVESRSITYSVASVENSMPVETPLEVLRETPDPALTARVSDAAVASPNVSEPLASKAVSASTALVSDDSSLLLYEERLSTRKQRIKTGEVRISKRIVTETTDTATLIKKEKIIIEIESIYGGDTKIDVDAAEVAEDGSISMGIYEERAEVCRQVQPYQNVSVRKEVVEDVVKTQETLRREELSVDPDGLPYVDWVDG